MNLCCATLPTRCSVCRVPDSTFRALAATSAGPRSAIPRFSPIVSHTHRTHIDQRNRNVPGWRIRKVDRQPQRKTPTTATTCFHFIYTWYTCTGTSAGSYCGMSIHAAVVTALASARGTLLIRNMTNTMNSIQQYVPALIVCFIEVRTRLNSLLRRYDKTLSE